MNRKLFYLQGFNSLNRSSFFLTLTKSRDSLTYMTVPNEILSHFPKELQRPVGQLGEWVYDTTARREDFVELKQVVHSLADAIKRTQEHVEELAQAQKRTEERVEELAQAQKRTEERVEELAIAMKQGFQRVNDQISSLGSRWGIKNETTIRNTISALMKKSGYTVSRGYFGDREVDLVIKNGEHILLEITSSALKKDVRNLNLSADDYLQKVGVEPKLMIAAVYVSPSVMREILDSPRKIEIFSGDDEEMEDSTF